MVTPFTDPAAMPKTDTDLYRAIKNGTFEKDLFVANDEPATGLLYPRFEAVTYVDGFGKEHVSNGDVTVHPLPTGDEVEAAHSITSPAALLCKPLRWRRASD